jgi:hypothetical protein
MYAYYGMCAMGEKQRNMMNAIKKYMTIIQLVRFCTSTHCFRLSVDQRVPVISDAIRGCVFQHHGRHLFCSQRLVQLPRVDGLGWFLSSLFCSDIPGFI